MSITIQDLLQQKIFPGVKAVAGVRGLRNDILWVNIMEIPDHPKTVQPGELLLTTGYGLEQEELYKSLIPELARRGVCGIAIQVGYYIDSIPPYILNQANELDFPVLLVPRNLTFSEFLHTMMRMLDPRQSSSWDNALLDQVCAFLTSNLPRLRERATAEGEPCSEQVLLMEPVNYSSADKAVWDKCTAEIWSFLQSNSLFFAGGWLPGNRCVFLTAHDSLDSFLSMFYRLNIKLTLLSEDFGVNGYLGAEELHRETDPRSDVSRAVEALNTLQLIRARRGVCYYGHIEFLKMFGQIHRKESSIVLDNQHLQMLLNYDGTNRTSYVQTLRVYLSNSGNITQTARQLFLHRHTLINRLEKIEEISALRLDDYYSRLYMSIALLLHDYFVY